MNEINLSKCLRNVLISALLLLTAPSCWRQVEAGGGIRFGESASPEPMPCELACPLIWKPVCGSDGHTYANECEFKAFNCIEKRDFQIANEGECSNNPVSMLESSEVTCKAFCPLDWTPVCGTDGVVYGNECELKTSACLKNKDVRMAYEGECIDCSKIFCTVLIDFVCGTDGKTYRNECELNKQNCGIKNPATHAYSGQCQEDYVV